MKRQLLILTIIFLLGFFAELSSQTIDPGTQSFVYPQRMQFGEFKSVFSLSMASLPEDIIETDDVFRAPLFAYDVKLGLPANFLIDASLNSNLITYHIALGAKWNYMFDRFSFAIGHKIAFWFGGLKQFGFDTKVRGWLTYPNVTFGYRFNKFTISLKGELILFVKMFESHDDTEILRDRRFVSGFAISGFIEQPLWSDNYLVVGYKANFTKFYYPQWAAFSTFDRFFFIPEVIVGLIL